MAYSFKRNKSIINTEKILLQPLKVKFDINTLNMVLSFIYKDSTLRTRKTLTNFLKLFDAIDPKQYEEQPAISKRVWVIKKTLYAKLVEGIETSDNLKTYCKDDLECDEYSSDIIDSIADLKISYDESKYLIKKMDDALEFGYIVTIKDILLDLLHKIDDEDFKSYKGIADDIYAISNSVINIRRQTSSLDSDMTFSLESEEFDSVVEEAVQRLKDRNRIFVTGVQRLNTILSPGYMSKRLYTYLAFPGKGKSTILLKSALDIRKYNSIKPKDPDKRPAVLFLTLENDIAETIERIYNMSVDSDDIRNYTPKQIKNKLRKQGGLELTTDNSINIIIKEYKNRELSTDDLYTIIEDLSDDGVEVVALVVDYMKRLRSAEKADNEKAELKNISNELKEVAKFFDLTCITAQQLNRMGASIIDAALQANKEDVTRLVGRDAIAGAWEILENSDWTCIINPETKMDDNSLYLIFKLLKRRYRSTEANEKLRRLDYFAHPFEKDNDIKLRDDIDLPASVSLESLSVQFSAVNEDESRKSQHAVEREEKSSNKKKKSTAITEDVYDPFNLDSTIQY